MNILRRCKGSAATVKAPLMIFRKDQQSATLSLDFEPDGRPVARITKIAASGKQSVSSLKHTAQFAGSLLDWAKSTVMDRAAVKLLKDGYRVFPPQDGQLQLALLSEMGPRVGMPFAVELSGSCAWLGDYEVVRKVDLVTAEVVDIPLASGTIVLEIAVNPEGQLWILTEHAQQSGLSVLRLRDGQWEVVEQLPRAAPSSIAPSLAISQNDRYLHPHAEGAAIYDGNQALLHILPAQPTRHHWSQAAIDTSGTWAVATAGPSSMRRLNLASGQWEEWSTPVDDVLDLWINPNGWVHIAGPNGCWRCDPTATQKLNDSCYVHIDEQGRCTSAKDLPMIGLVRSCRIQGHQDRLYARTDLGVFQMLKRS
jgi:hypothetical protein